VKTPVKLAAFGGGLVLAFAAALGVGTAVGPVAGAAEGASHGAGHGAGQTPAAGGHGASPGAGGGERAEAGSEATDVPRGLMVSSRGYTLDLAARRLPVGTGVPVAFRVLGADGEPVTSYTESHEEDLHLIAVRRDTTGFQHVHPELGPDGTWRVPLDLTAGSWRVFADFVPGEGEMAGQTLTLGADLDVAGDYRPVPLPAASPTAQVDGYTVTLDGELVPGEESELTLSVSRGGQPVRDLQPYLGAYGHLVALRVGDLAYLHVHPAGEPGDGRTQPGPGVTFYASVPSAGDYRLYLDFRHDGVVRTVEFTATATATATATEAGPAGGTPSQTPTDGHGSDGHTD